MLTLRDLTASIKYRYVEAASDCQIALSIDPTMVRLCGRRGRALLRLGDLFAAESAFDSMLIASSRPLRPGEVPPNGDTESGLFVDDVCRQDALGGLSQVNQARQLHGRLSDLIQCADGSGALEVAEELLVTCPHMRVAQVLKVKALFLQQKWMDAKVYIEKVTLLVHESIQSRNVHSKAQLPSPSPEHLTWVEIGAGLVRVDVKMHVQVVMRIFKYHTRFIYSFIDMHL